MHPITKKVYEFITKHHLITQGDKVLVSVSAGKDSMALLHILNLLKNEIGFTIGVYHLDHKVRGEESFDDCIFVAHIAASLGVSAFIERYDFVFHKSKRKSFEQQAREYRYAQLALLAREYNFTKIATAHTASDQIETIVMRMYQGTGLWGLQGIHIKRDKLIRPLLCLYSNEVYEYLQSNELSYRYDSSNDDIYYLRNYVRNKVLPVVSARFSHYSKALENIQQQATIAVQSINELMQTIYQNFITVHRNSIVVDEKALRHSEYIFKFCCSYIITTHLKQYVSSRQLDALYRACKSNKKNATLFNADGVHIYRRVIDDRAVLVFTCHPQHAITYEYHVPIGHEIIINEIGMCFMCTVSDNIVYSTIDKKTVHLAYTGYDSITVRNRRKGDFIIRKSGRRSLKKLFIDVKLSPEHKQCIPIVEVNNQVAAVLFNCCIERNPDISVPFLPDVNKKMLVITYWSTNNA